MVWSHEDFMREVRRQLVELESLRKGIAAKADISESIDKLEESHHYLLRKLFECSQADSGQLSDTGPNGTGPNGTGPNDTGPNDTGPNDTGPNGTGPSGIPGVESVDSVPPSLQPFVEALVSHPGFLQELHNLSSQLESAGDHGATLVILSIHAGIRERAREGSDDGYGKPYSLN